MHAGMEALPNIDPPRIEVALPEGCPLCGGEMKMRLSSGGAWSCCNACHWLTQPLIRKGPNGLLVEYTATLQA